MITLCNKSTLTFHSIIYYKIYCKRCHVTEIICSYFVFCFCLLCYSTFEKIFSYIFITFSRLTPMLVLIGTLRSSVLKRKGKREGKNKEKKKKKYARRDIRNTFIMFTTYKLIIFHFSSLLMMPLPLTS